MGKGFKGEDGHEGDMVGNDYRVGRNSILSC